MSPPILSAEMEDFLRSILAYERDVARFEPKDERDAPPAVPIRALRGTDKKTRADSASFSRRLRRLEAHGLLILCNVARGVTRGSNVGKLRIDPVADKRTRADHVMLTAAGRAVARQAPSSPCVDPAVTASVSHDVPHPHDAIAAAEMTSPPAPLPAEAGPPNPRPSPRAALVRPCQWCEREALPDGRFCDNCFRIAACIPTGGIRLCIQCHRREARPNKSLCPTCS